MAVDYSTLKKGGFMRQKQKNCFSLRLAVVGGNLTAENLKTIAEVADKYGDGHVHLTSRQSCLLYTSPSPRDTERSRMPSSA